MDITLILVPYDSGQEGVRMGRGPEQFMRQGVEETLRTTGGTVRRTHVIDHRPFRAEISTSFALYGALAEQVRTARAGGTFPLVLAGNCGSALGTLAGSGPDDIGIVWFDGHADCHTPETTTSGFLDGMGLAIATGRCWRRLAAAIPGFVPIPDDRVLLMGARAIDPAERDTLAHSTIIQVVAARVREHGLVPALGPALAALQERVQAVYLHLDMDALDPVATPANEYAPADGLTVDHVADAIALIGTHFEIRAAGVTAYDPAYDQDGRTAQAGLRLIHDVVVAARR